MTQHASLMQLDMLPFDNASLTSMTATRFASVWIDTLPQPGSPTQLDSLLFTLATLDPSALQGCSLALFDLTAVLDSFHKQARPRYSTTEKLRSIGFTPSKRQHRQHRTIPSTQLLRYTHLQ